MGNDVVHSSSIRQQIHDRHILGTGLSYDYAAIRDSTGIYITHHAHKIYTLVRISIYSPRNPLCWYCLYWHD